MSQRFTTPAAFADTKRIVIDRDPARLSSIATDFVFDATVAACYSGGAIPADLALIAAPLQNLANDVNPFLGRVGAVQASANDAANKPRRNGLGIEVNGYTRQGLLITKGGVADNRVAEPSFEGFIDVLVTMVLRFYAVANQEWPLYGPAGSASVRTVLTAPPTFDVLPAPASGVGYDGPDIQPPVANRLCQLGLLLRYNTGAGATSGRFVRDGLLGAVSLDLPAPASFPVDAAGQRLLWGGGNAGTPPHALLHRITREYVGLAGLTDDDIAAKVAKEWAYSRVRFA